MSSVRLKRKREFGMGECPCGKVTLITEKQVERKQGDFIER